MTPQESLDGIIAGLRCGICPEGKMRENPCHVCTGKYAAIERVRALFAASESVVEGLREHVRYGCAGLYGTKRQGGCVDCGRVDTLERAMRGKS